MWTTVAIPRFIDKTRRWWCTPWPCRHRTANSPFQRKGFTISRYNFWESNLTSDAAVAGTHGKTTASSKVPICFLSKIGAAPSWEVENYASNLLLSESPITVVEADEYDRSFAG